MDKGQIHISILKNAHKQRSVQHAMAASSIPSGPLVPELGPLQLRFHTSYYFILIRVFILSSYFILHISYSSIPSGPLVPELGPLQFRFHTSLLKLERSSTKMDIELYK